MPQLETLVGAGAAVYGVGMSLSPLLQVRAMIRSRSSRDQSLGYYWVLLVGFTWWVAYGVVSSDPFVLVPNAVAIVSGATALGVARYYRRYNQPPTYRPNLVGSPPLDGCPVDPRRRPPPWLIGDVADREGV